MSLNKESQDLQRQINMFFKKKPKIKKAMDVFGMSIKEYTKAISSLTKKNVIVTSNNTNGDMGGN